MSTALGMSVDEQVKHLCGLLREYSDKLAELCRQEGELQPQAESQYVSHFHDPFAWWMDSCLRMKKPLLAVVSLASQTLEHLELEPIQRDELTLRLAEIEVHLHHLLRRYHHWDQLLSKDKRLKALIDPLRMSHGLPGEVTR